MAEKTVYERSLELHEKNHGKVEVISKVKVENREDLSLAYTPGVAEPCRKIHANPDDVYKYTAKGNLVAVVSEWYSSIRFRRYWPSSRYACNGR